MFNPISISLQTLALSFDAQQVIQLRLAKLLFGGTDAHAEAVEMVREKVAAISDVSLSLALGRDTGVMLSALHEVVTANLIRLSPVEARSPDRPR